jgi:hypothetical protein
MISTTSSRGSLINAPLVVALYIQEDNELRKMIPNVPEWYLDIAKQISIRAKQQIGFPVSRSE